MATTTNNPAMAKTFLTAQAAARNDQVQSYLGFGAEIVCRFQASPTSKTIYLIEIDACNAEWQAGRLMSGWYGGSMFQTYDEASKDFHLLCTLNS